MRLTPALVIVWVCCVGGIAEAACTSAYKTLILTFSPTAFWCMNEASPSGATMTDYSGNSQNGTYGSTTVASATGIVADGTNDPGVSITYTGASFVLATVPTNASFINLASFTYVSWFKFSGSLTSPAYSVTGGTTDQSAVGWFVSQNNTATTALMTAYGTGVQGQPSIGALFDGGIHLLAVGVTGTTVFGSLDGATYTNATIAAPGYTAGTRALLIGANYNSQFQAAGTYQDTAIFSGQLSQTNLSQLYNCGHSGACGGGSKGGVIIGQ